MKGKSRTNVEHQSAILRGKPPVSQAPPFDAMVGRTDTCGIDPTNS